MKILLSCLKKFVDVKASPQELAHQLTMGGFEVEALEHFSVGFEKVVVGKILEIESHPNADRLTLCKVDNGKEILSIVCGAKNISVNDVVPVALDGAKLPGDKKITASKIRGEFSQGMLCSKKELGLGEDTQGIWLLPKDLKLGSNVSGALGLEDQALILNITANRGDVLSIRGAAREVAALTQTVLKNVSNRPLQEATTLFETIVQVCEKDFEACPRYMARVIRNVKVGPSPFWLVQKLERMGHRSINNIVDVTNWILLELGHPLHAFDLDRLAGSKIIVRKAKEGERLLAIDGSDLKLDPSMLVIADEKKPVALAGVMGGKESEVSGETQNILLECAFFDPSSVRQTSRGLNLISESSYRFERGVDPLGQPEALDEAAVLIQELAGGEVLRGVADVYPKPFVPREMAFHPQACEKLLGCSIPEAEVESLFQRLSIQTLEKKQGSWKLKIPSYRHDLTKEVDLIEEVVRLWGYDRVPQEAAQMNPAFEGEPFSGMRNFQEETRSILRGLGLSEVINYSFLSPELLKKAFQNENAIPLLNPIRQDYSHLRTSLIPGLMTHLSFNENRGLLDIQIFEIGKCYFPEREERNALGLALMGKVSGMSWGEKKDLDFFDLKGLVEGWLSSIRCKVIFRVSQAPGFHPGRCAQAVVEGHPIGVIGEAHPDLLKNFGLRQRVFLGEFRLEEVLKKLPSQKTFQDLPKYPAIRRDIAMVVEETMPYGDIESAIWEKAPALLKSVELFDVYQGEQVPAGHRSLALSLCFRSDEGTLKDEEIDALEKEMKNQWVEKLKCQFR
ncbi:MAG: phenylalanine--tRNA ligase subunit beta [Chlamydiae bacterium]|nr:phenylalanine--tRNA ligase subunit beta [Chlamydiota bacterium]MBI3266074.1 phenylalanine--tRNA ligase subunit beta [Chlamydiota bacterium]